MDRFKFRAWNIREKKYNYNIQDDYDSINGLECFGYYFIDRYKYNYIVEQCTGLKDKNGQLIYEGDLIRKDGVFAGRNYKDFYIGTVKFSDRTLSYFIDWDVANMPTLDSADYNHYEVIGNIHETPIDK